MSSLIPSDNLFPPIKVIPVIGSKICAIDASLNEGRAMVLEKRGS